MPKMQDVDPNEIGSALVASSTGLALPTGVVDALKARLKAREMAEKAKKNPAAVALGRLGGLKGGKARAEALSGKERKEIASNAAKKRWAAQKQSATTAAKDAKVLKHLTEFKTTGEIARQLGVNATTIRLAVEKLKQGPRLAKRSV